MTLCEICGERPAVAECRVCGRRVCSSHISNGLCEVCRETLCAICGERLSIGYCVVCGRQGCDECLVQVDNVRRVCRDCLRKLQGGGSGVLHVKRLGFKPGWEG